MMSETMPQQARAIVMQGYGPPEVLQLAQVDLPPLQPDEVRLRMVAAAVNHTDLEIRAGNWPIRKTQPFPYTPGVEVVGIIDAVGDAVHGLVANQPAITMMQGLGGVRAERPGGYAEFVTVRGDAVAPLAASVDLLQMAALGLGAVTAYEGLRRLGPLAGRRVLVTGAAGGVGSAAISLARAQGASVIAWVSRAQQIDYARSLGANEVVVAARGNIPTPRAASVDGVLDTVAGDAFGRTVEALRPGGVLCLVGAVGGSAVNFDAWHLINPVTLTGYSSENLSGDELRRAIAAICGWLNEELITPPHAATLPLAQAAHAHRMLESGGVKGRVLLLADATDSTHDA